MSKPLPTWQTEFPDYPPEAMPVIPEGFVDTSWRNDMCPIFFSPALRLCLFIDYPDPSEREFQDSPRFGTYKTDEEGGRLAGGDEVDMLTTDDWSEVLQFLSTYKPEA